MADKISKFTSQKVQRERLERRDFEAAAVETPPTLDPLDVVVAENKDEPVTLRDVEALSARIDGSRHGTARWWSAY